ncbi:MAG: hypothetical protein VYE29_06120 [Pseudomonadota bacterium]|nr:hypothetical protein [Pseudomonadota bacterium]
MIEKKTKKLHEVTHFYDYLKHLATLSTGSLLLLVAVAERFANNPEWGILFGGSIAFLLISIISSLICMFFVLSNERYCCGEDPEWEIDTIIFSFLVTGAFFILGVFSLVVFAIKNFST